MKNLKRQEIELRLAAIQEVAGRPSQEDAAVDEELLDQLLQGDFDPAQYDQLMARAFGQDYYEAGVWNVSVFPWNTCGEFFCMHRDVWWLIVGIFTMQFALLRLPATLEKLHCEGVVIVVGTHVYVLL